MEKEKSSEWNREAGEEKTVGWAGAETRHDAVMETHQTVHSMAMKPGWPMDLGRWQCADLGSQAVTNTDLEGMQIGEEVIFVGKVAYE